jgi:alpha-L-rhamnosidase
MGRGAWRWLLAVGVVAVAGAAAGRAPPAAAGVQGPPPASGAGPGAPLPPTRLRVEYLDSPLTIDVPVPRFSWALAHTGRAQSQTAYRLVVVVALAGAPPGAAPPGAVVWDSGVVPSNRSVNVPYGGPALPSDADFSWTVAWTDALGATSAPARGTFSTALLAGAADWLGAAWVSSPGGGALNTYRAEFVLPAAPVRARLYVSGLGYAKTWLNGALTDDHELGPATVFHRRVLYDVADVAPLLRPGANALGVMLGRGWFAAPGGNSSTDWSGAGPRQFMLLLSVTGADNATLRFVSALAAGGGGGGAATPLVFNATTGPVSDPSLTLGEAYDGRVAAALSGWSAPGYAPGAGVAWVPASPPAVSPATLGAALSAHSVVARPRRDFAPVNVSQPLPGLYAFDFGQNMNGLVTLRTPASGCPTGTVIALQLTETASRDGVPTNQFCERPKQWLCGVQQRANYTCAGTGGAESYRVTLSSMGFRYASLAGWPSGAPPPTADALTAHFVHADVEEIGNFTSSSPLLNAIQGATVASVLSNLADYPTDCPTRERRGWMDANHVLDTVLRAVDGGALYTKWVRDFADAAEYANASFGAAGALPDVVPFYGGGQPDADPAWGLAAWTVPAAVANAFDDDRLEAWWYPTARAYTEHWVALAQAHGGAPNVSRYGDWGNMWGPGMPQPFIVPEHAPLFYALALDAQAGAASRLGLAADAARYSALAAGARALLLTYFDAATGCFSNCSSATSQVFGLAAGVLPAGSPASAAAWARALAIFGPNGTHPDRYGGGEISIGYLFSLLEGAGLQGLALRTQLHTDAPPSPGFWVAQGATTLWEYWENTASTWNSGLNSYNHIMYGAPGAFYYSSLAGLRRAPGSRSWRTLLLVPPGSATGVWAKLSAASASQSTPMGVVAVAWALGDGGATYALNATVPPGAVATLVLPTVRAAAAATVAEGGVSVWAGGRFVPGTPGVASGAAGDDGDSVVFELGSGVFAFTTQ